MGKDGKEYEIDRPSHRWIIDKYLEARKKYAFGDQYDYFGNPNCIGWTRLGDENNKGGIALLLSNGEDGFKKMQSGTCFSSDRNDSRLYYFYPKTVFHFLA